MGILAAGAVACAGAYEPTPEMLATGLKTVMVETIGGEEPVCTEIHAPEGSWGVGITDVNKVPGSVRVIGSDGDELFYSGEYLKKESGMTVKVRGNTSARYAKKPFKIKLEKKGDLLCRGDKSLNDKNWVLLTSSNNLYELGFLIGEWIGMPWAPAYEYVHLVMNGDYRGVYTLVEAVERNEKCRIRTEETGFVAERDAYWWNEDGQYLPSGWNPQFNWTLKYPDFEDLTSDGKAYISGVLADFEAIIQTEDYEELIDIDSFCKWLIAQDILGTSDGGGTNFYLAKDDDTADTKLYVPVLWDVDSGEETENVWSAVHRQGMIKPLFDNANEAFRKRYVDLYQQLSPTIYANIESLTASMRGDEWAGFNKGAALNDARWGKNTLYTSSHNADDMDWWFPARRLWLDNAVADLQTTLGVDGVTVPTEDDGSVNVYTLEGVRIYSGPREGFSAPSPGLYIVAGRNAVTKLRY